ncbi:MAG TPA: HlyD family type I secretion periplasmic adaptor subunit [Phenylobacterium sp.]|nr:HlyD family type I secretion periplasmic adaptor subunit [Phenylobacterium sp.]
MKLDLNPMKIDFKPLKPYVTPSFRMGDQALDPDIERRMKRPMVVGSWIVGVFVIGIFLWAALAPLTGAVMAPGVVRVEANRKTIRHLAGGTVKAIPVHEGQHVAAGQVLLVMDDVQPRASVDVLQSQVDSYEAQMARFAAESTGKRSIDFPADLTARISDPRVATVIRDQQFLFTTRLQFFESQNDVLEQRIQQIDAQIGGVKAQIDATNESIDLTKQELAGYQTLFEKGYAPKTLILRYQRSLADLAGRKGELLGNMTRLSEQKGETRLQMVAQREERVSQAAEGLRQMQTGYSDASPKLTAARQMLAGTLVRSPVDGYVLDLTQFTVGGIIGAGELLMNIVPANAPLIISVRLKPTDIDDVRPGMKARVRLTAFNYRKVSPIEAVVTNVSADQLNDQKTGEGYFRADLKISPAELAKLPKGAVITPGMPAQAMITTGKKTVLSYIISPLTDTLRDAMREG